MLKSLLAYKDGCADAFSRITNIYDSIPTCWHGSKAKDKQQVWMEVKCNNADIATKRRKLNL